jgi:CHAT domain-containing protein
MGHFLGRCFAVMALSSLAAQATPLSEGLKLRDEGRLHQASAQLQQALQQADSPASRQRATAALIGVLIDSGRIADAESALQQALQDSEGEARAGLLLDAGRLALVRGDTPAARQAFEDSVRLAGNQLALRQRAELNLARLDAAAPRRTRLQALEPSLTSPELLLNLAAQAQQLGDSALAHRALQRTLQASGRSQRQQIEALDALAALYENQQRPSEALQLSREALALLPQLPPALQSDLRVQLEWRMARLQAAQSPAALAAYQRAVAQLEAVRIDWPLQTIDGRSSYEALFQPLYMGLVDGLLRAAAAAPPEAQQALLRRARDALEQLRQAELQDYLGDRCEVDAVKAGSSTELPAGSAVIYPLLFADRVELLVEDRQGLAALPSSVSPAAVREAALRLASRLRERAAGFQSQAQILHGALLQPLHAWLTQRGIDTLVWVNDGPLRLVPMGALHDGSQYAIERYAVVNALGMSMTNTAAPRRLQGSRPQALVAGAGRFGPVVDKLAQEAWAQPLRRQLLGAVADTPGATRSLQAERLRDALELPGVSQEVEALGQLLPSRALQDAGFTVQRFSGQVQQGNYRVVHIASHGVFGGSAASSYLLAYDDLLTLGGLQDLLLSDTTRRQPIELLTLSACQTAEGNDRAPLGIAGAAIKARARAVLGTLWPVDDEATVLLMQGFYRGWTQAGDGARSAPTKGQALRDAQRALLAKPATRHPYYWAPFALIGNWL